MDALVSVGFKGEPAAEVASPAVSSLASLALAPSLTASLSSSSSRHTEAGPIMEAPSMEAAVEVEAEEEEEEATATKPRRAALTEGSSSSTGKKKKKKKRKKKQNKGSRQKASVSKILLQGEAGGLQPLQARGGVVGPLPSIAPRQAITMLCIS